MRALHIIYTACNPVQCDLDQLKRLDDEIRRDVFIGALRNPFVVKTHLFYPSGRTAVADAFDWDINGPGSARAQLLALKTAIDAENTIIFIIGKASTTGDVDINRRLSYERVINVRAFLDAQGIRCRVIKGGWLGKEVMQFNELDASWLDLRNVAYRNDLYVLNQAVHVLAFPCADDFLKNHTARFP